MPLFLLNIPGLREKDVAVMPQLREMTAAGQIVNLVPSFPCVTCPVQANMTTGRLPSAHGVVANGLYWRQKQQIEMWTSTNDCIERPQIWDLLSHVEGAVTSAVWFAMHSVGSEAEYICAPKPIHNPDGTESDVFNFTASGTGPTPTIASIVTTYGNELSQSPQIAQNAWVEVHGANLSQITATWSTLPASDFTTSLPTTLGGVSATVDGKPAAVSYVSPTQVNILAPLDSATGSVPVQLNTPYGQTAIQTVTEQQTSPAFLVLDAAGHVAALHLLNYAYLGPASLGASFTPAAPGETVLLYATGFGQTNPPIANQLTGLGALPTLPAVTIGNLPATVSYAGISAAGLYQFNVIVPTSAPAGDLPLLAMYNGSSTQSSVVITVQ